MKLIKPALAIAASLVIVSLNSGAQEDASSDVIQAQILESLKSARPDLEYTDITASPIPGYYQIVVSGGMLLYVSEDGSHFFAGELYHVEPGAFVNATEAQRTSERQQLLADVDEESMIIFPAVGESKGILTVFTDVTCGYCRKLHEQMAEMNEAGIEVHYLAYPRSGIERDGAFTHEYIETVKAWCAEDRNTALTELKAGQAVAGEICEDNPVADHYTLGRVFGVTGTPAIVLPDGSLNPGYRTTADFLALLGISE
jgi:thiol:disulfide interchange protein DsbC